MSGGAVADKLPRKLQKLSRPARQAGEILEDNAPPWGRRFYQVRRPVGVGRHKAGPGLYRGLRLHTVEQLPPARGVPMPEAPHHRRKATKNDRCPIHEQWLFSGKMTEGWGVVIGGG